MVVGGGGGGVSESKPVWSTVCTRSVLEHHGAEFASFRTVHFKVCALLQHQFHQLIYETANHRTKEV